MFRNIAEDIAFLLITHKIISIDKRDAYMYGLEAVLLNSSLMIVCLVISLLCREMINFLAYLIFFVPLRIFTGGYHAKTSEKHFIISTLMYGVSIAAVKLFPLIYQRCEGRLAGLIAVLFISIMTPMIKKKLNRTVTYSILAADLVFFIFCCINNRQIASNELVFIILVFVSIMIEKLNTYLSEDDELL